MKKLNKGFTMIELLIVIAIIGILATTFVPKLIKEMRKATVAKVQHNLGVIRSRLSLDETLLDEFPDLAGEDNTVDPDLLKAYSIESTPPFTDENGVSHGEISEVVDSRTDDGGWYYIRSSGEIYANLPDGAYTKDQEYEIWNGEDEEIEDNSGSDWDNIGFSTTKSGKVYSGSGGDFYESPWGSGKYIVSINPGVGNLGISGAKLNGNYQVYIDGQLIESNSGNPSSDGQGINISHHNIDVPEDSKLLNIAFEYVDRDGLIKVIYNSTRLF